MVTRSEVRNLQEVTSRLILKLDTHHEATLQLVWIEAPMPVHCYRAPHKKL